MTNLLIYLNPRKFFDEEHHKYAEIQIDNGLNYFKPKDNIRLRVPDIGISNARCFSPDTSGYSILSFQEYDKYTIVNVPRLVRWNIIYLEKGATSKPVINNQPRAFYFPFSAWRLGEKDTSFTIYNDAPLLTPEQIAMGVPEPTLIVDSITPDTEYRWLRLTVNGQPFETLNIPPQQSVTVDVEVDFAYSPEGQSVLLTIHSNAPGPEPTVFVLVKLN